MQRGQDCPWTILRGQLVHQRLAHLKPQGIQPASSRSQLTFSARASSYCGGVEQADVVEPAIGNIRQQSGFARKGRLRRSRGEQHDSESEEPGAEQTTVWGVVHQA
jgi:hypothetical protein